jgi:hypothetical protein
VLDPVLYYDLTGIYQASCYAVGFLPPKTNLELMSAFSCPFVLM